MTVLDATGRGILTLDLSKTGGQEFEGALTLAPGEYYLAVSPTPIHVLLGYDSSGSMSYTFDTTREAITAWADRLPPGELERAHRNRVIAWLNANRRDRASVALEEAERAGFRLDALRREIDRPGS